MATINDLGNITATCIGCQGTARSSFLYYDPVTMKELGIVRRTIKITELDPDYQIPSPFGPRYRTRDVEQQHRLFRCENCYHAALAIIHMKHRPAEYPRDIDKLVLFIPEAGERLPIPAGTPPGIHAEFREAELCRMVQCFRAAAAMFRSTMEKALKHNGYSKKESLFDNIELAHKDNLLTAVHYQWAQRHIRIVGNDVLHDDRTPETEFDEAQVRDLQMHTQRILESLYADRDIVLQQLRKVGRRATDDDSPVDGATKGSVS